MPIGECLIGPELSGSASQTPAAVTLDAENPVAEQTITVRSNAEALPADHVVDFRLLVRVAEPRPAVAASPDPSAGPAATGMADDVEDVIPEVMIIRDDTDTVVAVSSPNQPLLNWVAAAPIDCPLGEACDRTYRIRVAARDLQGTATLSFSWWTSAIIRYEGVTYGCGVPEDAELAVDGGDPESRPGDEVAFAPEVGAEELGGVFVSRHVVVTSDRPDPSAASLRLSVLQKPQEDPRETDWTPWVRVVADGSSAPLADAAVGRQPQGGADWDPATLDVPILTDCVEGTTCERGYWILFQNLPPWAAWPSFTGEPPPTLGQLSWSVAGTATYPDGSAEAGGLRVVADDLDGGLAAGSVADASAEAIVVVSDGPEVAIDAVIAFPDRPQSVNGLDPLAGSVVLVHAGSDGGVLYVTVTGPGTYGEIGYSNGDGSRDFVTHPFDACPPRGRPCTVRLRLIGTPRLERVGNTEPSTELVWRVTVVGAPMGTTIDFVDP